MACLKRPPFVTRMPPLWSTALPASPIAIWPGWSNASPPAWPPGAVLNDHPRVVEAAVVAHPDPVLGEKVHAFVIARDEGLNEEDVRAFCRLRLADYKVPEFVTIGTSRCRATPSASCKRTYCASERPR